MFKMCDVARFWNVGDSNVNFVKKSIFHICTSLLKLLGVGEKFN